MDTILVVNAGSSSVKFQVFETSEKSGLKRLIKGQMDGIGVRPKLRATTSDGTLLVDQPYAPDRMSDVAAALGIGATWLRETQKLEPVAIGHRVVHGGPRFNSPVLVDRDVIAELERYVSLAPLHQPNNLAPIRALFAHSPELPQVACFDTAFHHDHDALADHYALPVSLYDEGVRRYGFHGLSYEFVASCLPQLAPKIALGRVIVAHLGSGASMCALSAGRSVESTMGFTALDGLPMGTRPGQLDPGVILYLLQEKQMTADQIQKLLYGECGLKGLSGISNDVRDLQESSDPQARFALDYFAYRVALHSGWLAAALRGLDGFVFTAGIGENSPTMRSRIVERLALFGAVLDPDANAAGATSIAAQTSRIEIYVVKTDEELMIARHTLALLTALG
ncbi:acetate kinase [Phyllobacterium sp. 1468]|uniref:acetate/propionate family kinase n=1 Tax=Phyllobacterium sp. 1468 TaxID=2817759 RepID=UPI0028666F4E|nr:acetate/propionate family kinase [Phyllobacterium sp. 1468]MDR6635437.1 acetate kinase [Phyllobacterium sp. 1468]